MKKISVLTVAIDWLKLIGYAIYWKLTNVDILHVFKNYFAYYYWSVIGLTYAGKIADNIV